MKFDDVDDDLDLGYTPSMINNSRSAGMKKLARKTDNKPKPAPAKKPQADELDLLDQLLSPAKPTPKTNQSKPKEPIKKFEKDDIDSFFDEPSIKIEKPKQPNTSFNQWKESNDTSKIDTTVNTTFNSRPQTAKAPVISDDVIIQETNQTKPTSSFKFKRPQTAMPERKKSDIIEEEPALSMNPSSRMMKPPLRKRQSKEEIGKKSQSSKAGFGGLSLPEQPQKFSFSKKQQPKEFKLSLGDDKQEPRSLFVAPPKQKNSSIDMENSELTLKIEQDLGFGKKTESMAPPILNKAEKFTLKLDSPQSQKPNKFQSKQRGKKLWEAEKSYLVNEEKEPQQRMGEISHSEMERQIDFIKRNYQKHIDTLQKNLEDQIKVNKDSRDRLMREVNQMIDSERTRLKKIHEQEIDRVKQMGQWEKKKLQDSYKMQIQSLKSQLERANLVSDRAMPQGYSSIEIDKKQIKYLQEKLRAQRKSLEDREKILDRRQLALEESQRQFMKRKRHEEERLRDEQKRIFQSQMQNKKNILQQRRALEEQKQVIATQMASLELGNFKKIEAANHIASEAEVEKKQLEKEKRQMRDLHKQAMGEYKKKQEQLQKEKQRISQMESQLVKKLRVVEAKVGKDNSTDFYKTKGGQAKVNQTINYKENSWMQENEDNPKRPMSAQKMHQHKKIEQTQNRFLHIAQTLKDSTFKFPEKGNGGFDISQYLMNMSKYTRTREGLF